MATEAKNDTGLKGGAMAAAALRQTDFWMAVSALALVGMLIVPLPYALLDLLLTFNIAFSIAVLLVTTYIKDPLEFSVFPSLLLFAALFRTALSVAVMRAILTSGTGGHLVESFGRYVLGDNYLIGFVIFLTLIVVQFVVVTGGANRIAEVAARFTLDSMPGKQMSIDADMNAGLINEEDARRRRKAVEMEADFYGAMDGASKFVRGDTIAAVIITAINIMGGVLIGLLQRNMDVMEALRTYALMTVGQGLLVQIPALLVSSASGLIVTRAASEENLGSEFAMQVSAQPRALYAAALGSLAIGVLPGLPKMPFLVLGVGLIAAARFLTKKPEPPPPPPKVAEPEGIIPVVQVDPLELELGFALVSMALEKEGGQLLHRITAMRKKMAAELGIFIPAIRVRDNLQLPANHYAIKLRGVRVAGGELVYGCLLAIPQGALTAPLEGAVETKDPTFGLPAFWIPAEQKTAAQQAGCAVVDVESVLITHLSEVVRGHSHELLTRQDVQALLDMVRQNHPVVLEELIPNLLSRGEVQRVLQNLLAEQVPLKDLVSILEAMADGARVSKDTDFLTEVARQRIARAICHLYQSDGGLTAIALDPELERRLLEYNAPTEQGAVIAPEPALLQKFLEGLSQYVESATGQGRQPVVACSPKIRLPLRRLLIRYLPRLAVISFEEAALSNLKLNTVGILSI